MKRNALARALVALVLQTGCGDAADAADAASASSTDASLPGDDGAGPAPLDAGLQLDATAQAALLDAFVEEPSSADAAARDAALLPYAKAVLDFRAGAHAGFGSESFPDVVLGPPRGKGTNAGSLDVLSLGVAGEIVVDLGKQAAVDGPGPDLVVFENAFWPGGQAESVFAELGEVSVSEDQHSWFTFVCKTQGSGQGKYPGCAGWTPTRVYDPFAIVPLDPVQTGGDAFDLADVSVTRARYVRIRDLSTQPGAADNAGFDLDAIGVIHAGD